MRVTVDINVLLDVFQKREPHYAASARMLAMVQQHALDAVFPALGFTTLYYLVRKHGSRPDAEMCGNGVSVQILTECRLVEGSAVHFFSA